MNKLILLVLVLSTFAFGEDNLVNQIWKNNFNAESVSVIDIRKFDKQVFGGYVPNNGDSYSYGSVNLELVVNGNVMSSKRSMVALQTREAGNTIFVSLIRFYESDKTDQGPERFVYNIINVDVSFKIKKGETKYIQFEGLSGSKIKLTLEQKNFTNFELITDKIEKKSSPNSLPENLTEEGIIAQTPNDGWTNNFVAQNLKVEDLKSYRVNLSKDEFYFAGITRGNLDIELVVDCKSLIGKHSMVAVQERKKGIVRNISVLNFFENYDEGKIKDNCKNEILNINVSFELEGEKYQLIKIETLTNKMLKILKDENENIKVEIVSE